MRFSLKCFPSTRAKVHAEAASGSCNRSAARPFALCASGEPGNFLVFHFPLISMSE
jgi:hypothetical protein